MENVTPHKAQRIYDAHRVAQAEMEAVYRSLAASRAETGRLQRLYNVAKRRRDAARSTWLDLSDTLKVEEQIGLDIDYRKRQTEAGAKAYSEVVNGH